MYEDDDFFDDDECPSMNGCTFCDRVKCDGSCEDDDDVDDASDEQAQRMSAPENLRCIECNAVRCTCA